MQLRSNNCSRRKVTKCNVSKYYALVRKSKIDWTSYRISDVLLRRTFSSKQWLFLFVQGHVCKHVNRINSLSIGLFPWCIPYKATKLYFSSFFVSYSLESTRCSACVGHRVTNRKCARFKDESKLSIVRLRIFMQMHIFLENLC